MLVENVDIKKLILYENNPRENEKAIEAVMESIKNYGFNVPLTITKNNVIVTGHTRYEASKRLKLKTIPCLRIDDLTEEQINAYRIVDNKIAELSSWDYVKLNEELEKLLSKGVILNDFEYKPLEIENVDDVLEEFYVDALEKKYKCPFCDFTGSKERFKKK